MDFCILDQDVLVVDKIFNKDDLLDYFLTFVSFSNFDVENYFRLSYVNSLCAPFFKEKEEDTKLR